MSHAPFSAFRPTLNRLAVAVATLCAALPAAFAQTAPVLPRPEPALPLPTPVPSRPLELKTPDRPALPAVPGLVVQVDRFVVTGATRLSQEELDAALAPFARRSLNYTQLQEAANALTDAYRRRGYLLALAYLPQQRIADGVVELAVLEGRLGTFGLSAAPGIDAGFAQRIAQWQLGSGEIVSEANLVRNLIVLNELPGIAVSAAVQPGTAVGTADVAIDARAIATGLNSPNWAGVVVLDNHGTPYTGRVRLGASATGSNLSGRGDLLSLRAVTSDAGGQKSLAGAYLTPVHPSGTRAGVSLSLLEYTLGERYAPLLAHGSAAYLSAQVEQPLMRSFAFSLDARALLTHKILRDHIDAFSSRSDRHLETLQVGLAGEARDEVRGGGRTFWNASLTTGRVIFDDAAAALADAQQLRTAGPFGKLNLEFGRQQLFAPRFSVTLRGLLQLTDSNLDSSERVTFDGANALRPYGALPTSADEALQLSVEARYVPEQNTLPGLALVAFTDVGRGRISSSPLTGSGTNHFDSSVSGVGAELPLPNAFSVRVAATREHVSQRSAGDQSWATRGWLEVVKSF